MNCPVCKKAMARKDFGDATGYLCKDGCKGLWFDHWNLEKLDYQNAGLGAALEEALHSFRAANADRGPINCPQCGIRMQIHPYKSMKETNVDECYGCGGFFLDSGELKAIRNHLKNEQENKGYFQKLFDEIYRYLRNEEGT